MRKIKFRAYFPNKAEMKIVAIQNIYEGNNTYLYLSPMPGSNYESIKLMQYTGLKDKNGKEIYEGDICETVTYSGKPFGTIDIVKFSGGAFKLTDIEDALLPIHLDDSDIQSIEVIGNIFQDGDLLRDS